MITVEIKKSVCVSIGKKRIIDKKNKIIELTKKKLEIIKTKLDKDFMTYSMRDSEISIFMYNVYYTLYIDFTTQEFWDRLEKNNLKIYEMRIYDGKIRLHMKVGDIRNQ